MGAPMVIKWTDGGAPTLSRAASSLVGVLDYCLPQKGWTKVFTGTDKAVFRAGSGTRKFIRVLNDDSFSYSGSTSYYYCQCRIAGYDAMTDADTGTGWWGSCYVTLSETGTPVPRPWMCIFNETTVLFVCLPTKTTGVTMADANSYLCGFGDTIAALPGNTSRCFLAGAALSDPAYNLCTITSPLTAVGSSSGAKIRIDRSLDGSRTVIEGGLFNNGGMSGAKDGEYYPFGRSTTAPYAYPYNGELLYGRPMLDDGLEYTMGDYIPGLFYPCHPGTDLDNWGDYVADDGDFIAVRVVSNAGGSFDTTSSSYIGAMLISLEAEDWT